MASQFVQLSSLGGGASSATTGGNNTFTGVNTYNNAAVFNSTLLVNSAGTLIVNGTASFAGTAAFTGTVTESNAFTILPQGTATNGANFASNAFNLDSSYWTGTAAAFDSWVWQTVLGTGANPYSVMNLAHSGTSGLITVYMPALDNTPIGLINPSPAAFSTANITTLLTLHVQGSGVTPTPAAAGSVALTHNFILAVWNGSAWVRASDGTTAVTF